MSVENKNVIDFVSIDKDGSAVLTIADHLEWDKSDNHLLILQEKINSYLDAIESGQLYEAYPNAKDRKIVIEVRALHSPEKEGLIFLQKVKDVIEGAGYDFYFKESD